MVSDYTPLSHDRVLGPIRIDSECQSDFSAQEFANNYVILSASMSDTDECKVHALSVLASIGTISFLLPHAHRHQRG